MNAHVRYTQNVVKTHSTHKSNNVVYSTTHYEHKICVFLKWYSADCANKTVTSNKRKVGASIPFVQEGLCLLAQRESQIRGVVVTHHLEDQLHLQRIIKHREHRE